MEKVVNKGKEKLQSRFLSSLMARHEEVQSALNLLMERHKIQKLTFSKDDFIEDFDQAEWEVSANKYYTLLERKSTELKKIAILINRVLEEKEFGLCEECGEKIPEERLLIIPEATLCVFCQRELEKIDSRKGSGKRSYKPLGKEKSLEWEGEETSVEKEGFIIETVMDDLSLLDLEETDLEGNGKQKME